MAGILRGLDADRLTEALRPRPTSEAPLPRRLPAATEHSTEALERRRSQLADEQIQLRALTGPGAPEPETLGGRIEAHVGFAQVPVGVIGPLRVNGSAAHGDFFVPLATTEGTLVASYQYSANVLARAGGISALCGREVVGRSPCFTFERLADAARCLAWLPEGVAAMREAAESTTRHGKLADVRPSLVGNQLFLLFEFETGDAAGQNMVTVATDAACRVLLEQSPTKPARWQIEANASGDKKATALALQSARGRHVNADALIPAALVKRFFRADAQALVHAWEANITGAIQSGTIGVQGNVANAIAALFLACGQDVACVSEAATGLTRIEQTADGDLYVSVTLPNLIVGTVGGGTPLPTARECLEMMDCYGDGKGRKLAEIFAAVALAGELAVTGAMASGKFADSHGGTRGK
ncbi:MAG: hydroxymethylglutaryl-CoA reductase [bacterium]|nr:hydroxymethylglutaryl-CoA reductase [bacterium]